MKDVKALLPQINYRVPNMRFLKDKLQVRTQGTSSRRLSSCESGLTSPLFTQEVEARSELTYPNFAQLYRTLMFDTQKTVSGSKFYVCVSAPQRRSSKEELKSFTLVVEFHLLHQMFF